MDVLNKVTDFIDDNIRVFRYSAPFLAVVGISVTLHYTHAFSVFKSANAIPLHIIARNLPLRGVASDVINERTIKFQHLPILFRNLERRQKYFGEKITPINIALAGISPKDGCLKYLRANLLHKNITILPLKATKDNCLEAIVYSKKSVISPSICINKELVAMGLATVYHNKELAAITAYRTLSKQLLAVEIKADKRGLGIWKRSSWKERFDEFWEILKKRTRRIYSKIK